MATPTLDSEGFNQLFGALAAKLKFISEDHLEAALRVWSDQKSISIGQILVDQDAISQQEFELLSGLVRKYIECRGAEVRTDMATVAEEAAESGVHPAHALIKKLADVDDAGIQTALADTGMNTIQTGPVRTTHSEETIAGDEVVESTVGRFPIVQTLGEGSFGTVFKALDSRLDRYVAIKVAKSSRQLRVDRFSREAKAAAQLRHQHIVPVYEYGTYGKTKFIVYEYVEGTTLKSALETYGKYDYKTAAETVSKLASALYYAHQQGIVHRDIKPENILIDHHDEPHITDFGLAKRMEEDVEQTIDGSVLGTPAYMSPEQARGQRADHRSDIWSLGVILGELITGRKPFHGTGVEMRDHIRNREPAPLRKFDPAVPKDIQTIWARCLEKERERRFSTALELADELDRWRRGEPIKSRPIGPFAKALLWVRRNPKDAGLLATVFLTILVAAVVSALFALRAHQERGQRVVERANAILYSVPGEFANQLRHSRTAGVATTELLEELARRQEDNPRVGVARVFYQQQPDPTEFRQVISDVLDAESDEECLENLGVLWDRHTDLARLSLGEQNHFRAIGALAHFDAGSHQLLNQVFADRLLVKASFERRLWARKLRAARELLRGLLYPAFRAGSIAAADILAELFGEDLSQLVDLIAVAEPAQLHFLLSKAGQHADADAVLEQKISQRAKSSAEVRANLAVLRLFLGEFSELEALLADREESPERAYLIDRIAAGGVPPGRLAECLLAGRYDGNLAVLSALLLAMGEYDELSLLGLGANRASLLEHVAKLYRTHRDPGVHGAAGWLLRRWGQPTAARALAEHERSGAADWFVTVNGHTMVVLRPSELWEPKFASEGEISIDQSGRVTDGYPFAISATEVTVAQFRQFVRARGIKDYQRLQKGLRQSLQQDQPAAPVRGVPLVDFSEYKISAVDYCFWLSERAGLEVSRVARGDQLQPSEYLGYRIPTSGEWRFAAYTGINRSLPFPATSGPAGQYACFGSDEPQPVALVRPNRLGLFDMFGNAAELCYAWSEKPGVLSSRPRSCGGSFATQQVGELGKSIQAAVGRGSDKVGFRIAITLSSETEKQPR